MRPSHAAITCGHRWDDHWGHLEKQRPFTYLSQVQFRKATIMAKSLLNALLSGAQDLTKGQGMGGLAAQAKNTWNNQSTLTKGAVAGGLLGVLLSGDARKLVGTGVKVGGAAVVGALAYRAYQDWKDGKQAGADTASPAALPAPSPAFLPQTAEGMEDLSLRMVQAMVAATKADGHVTSTERNRILAQLPNLGLGPEAEALIAAEIDAPFDVNRVAALAHTEEEAAEIYAASLLAVDPEAPAEKGYLAMLAARLQLDPGLVAHLHAKAGVLA
jgi:uncharacterized membrane protein YebE (DUF533 family)